MNARSIGCLLLLMLFLGMSPSAVLGDGPTVGPQFQVNSYTTSYQYYPAVAGRGEGDFVVVWVSAGSNGTDSDERTVQAQRYASDGSPLGGEFQVNTYTTDGQYGPSVAVATNGDFVVVWESWGSVGPDTSILSIQGQRFAANGLPVEGQFQVNSYTTDQQGGAAVAVDGDGNFVVVWESEGSPGSDSSNMSVQGQRFAFDGSPLGGQFQVNTYTTSLQNHAAVAVGADGSFVTVWRSHGSGGTDSSASSIQGRRFTSDGSPLGSDFQVNSFTDSSQGYPDVAVAADGGFMVVWESSQSGGTDSEGRSIQGRRFAADGTPLGSDFQVNSLTTDGQDEPRVGVDARGNFVVAWASDLPESPGSRSNSIQVQRYASDGSATGPQFQVNSYTTENQYLAAVAVDPSGDFVVVWSSEGSAGTDSSGLSVQAQRFTLQLFADGFESGDTSGWSMTMP